MAERTNFFDKSAYSKLKEKGHLFLNRVKNSEGLSLLAVFLFFLALNSIAYLTVSNVSSIDDQWFYFKITYLLRTEGWGAVANFQGAYFTELARSGYSYAIGLYHYFVMPFTLFGDKILGLKFSGLFLATIVPTLAYWVLRRMNVKKAVVWVALFFYALGSYNFTFRMFLNRPFVLIDALMLVEIYLIFKKKYGWFFVVSLINAWWHPATFWLPMMLACCYEVILLLHQKKSDIKNIIMAAVGSLSAFLLFPPHSHTFLSPMNPFYFIKTLFAFIYGLGNGPKIIEGSENGKGDIFGLLAKSNIIFIVLMFFVVLSVAFYIYRRKNDGKDLDKSGERMILREYVFLISIIFLLGYIFSQRFEDLLVPMVMLGSIISFEILIDNRYVTIENAVVRKVFLYSFSIILVVVTGNKILDFRNSVKSDNSYLKYEKAGNWLKNNTQKGDIVFNTDFGQFNRLFFYDDWNRYIVGLEPKNMYEYNHEVYWLWHNITLNGVAYADGDYSDAWKEEIAGKNENEMKDIMQKNAAEIARVIKTTFKSQYVFFDGDSFLKKEIAQDSGNFQLAYEDKDNKVSIYKIIKAE